MRIALDARTLAPADSGMGSYTLNLVRALLAADPDLELVLICRTTPAQAGLQDPRITVVHFSFPPMFPTTQYVLPIWLRPHAFDLFHAPFEVLPYGLRQPLVVTAHDLNWLVNPRYNSTNPLRRLVEGTYYRTSFRRAMQQARRLLAVSHATRHAILEYAPGHAGKTRVAYHGIDTQRIYPLAPARAWGHLAHLLPPGTPFVLTVGQGTPYKNHVNAVRGFLAAFGGHPHYRLVLVRRFVRHDKTLEALLRTPQAQAQVLRLPYVPPDVLNALYNAARIVLHPSYYERLRVAAARGHAGGNPHRDLARQRDAGDRGACRTPGQPRRCGCHGRGAGTPGPGRRLAGTVYCRGAQAAGALSLEPLCEGGPGGLSGSGRKRAPGQAPDGGLSRLGPSGAGGALPSA
jgi:glycosyltransferase involved in cell wall biosynthesis